MKTVPWDIEKEVRRFVEGLRRDMARLDFEDRYDLLIRLDDYINKPDMDEAARQLAGVRG